MVQDSWVGDLFPVSFFVFFCFPFCSSSPVSASVAWDGIGCFTLCASIPFLFFPLLAFLSLALMRADPALAGIDSGIINK